MNYLDFRERFHAFACFSTHQVLAAFPDFDRGNYAVWMAKGYLKRLRRSMYAFADMANEPGIGEYFSGKIYAPSYLSCEYALAKAGLIPESVVQFTAVSTLKTASFRNDFGEFFYRNIKPELMFGYSVEQTVGGFPVKVATPAKALCDFLYLNSQYNTPDELEALRLDAELLKELFQADAFTSLLARFNSKALSRRISLARKVYTR